MTQIIQLAQKQLEIEQIILSDLKAQKEYALDQAFDMQNQILGQQKKVNDFSENLEDLYRKYGYPSDGKMEAISPPMPKIKSTKPVPAQNIGFEDLRKKVLQVGHFRAKEALAVAGVKNLRDLEEEDYQLVMNYLISI